MIASRKLKNAYRLKKRLKSIIYTVGFTAIKDKKWLTLSTKAWELTNIRLNKGQEVLKGKKYN